MAAETEPMSHHWAAGRNSGLALGDPADWESLDEGSLILAPRLSISAAVRMTASR